MISSIFKIIAKIFSAFVIIVFITTVIGLIITWHIVEFTTKYDKNEKIIVIRNNIDDLNELNRDLLNKYGNMKYFNIGNEYTNSSIMYESELKNKLFEKIGIKEVFCDMQEKLVHYTIDTNSSTIYSFYYSEDNKRDLYSYGSEKDFTNDNRYILRYNNWAIMISKRSHGSSEYHSIYTENIIDNWYYYEDYWYSFEAIKYIEKDLKRIGKYDEVMEMIK